MEAIMVSCVLFIGKSLVELGEAHEQIGIEQLEYVNND